jgi:CMP-N-acetylneuraminic acid synthetase
LPPHFHSIEVAAEMPAVAIIHARGGSKRIPLKNLRLVGGQPLVAYPIQLCRQCAWIDRVIVSTDHEGIMAAARQYGAEVPFSRPAALAEDVPSELVTEHALRFLASTENALPDYVVTLTPATPFTQASDLDEAFRLLKAQPEWTAITTVRKAAEYPEWMIRVDDQSEAHTVLGNPLDGAYNVSQNLPAAYYPTGAFWINRVEPFLEQPSLYGRRWGALVVAGDAAIDIDWPEDLERAEQLLQR